MAWERRKRIFWVPPAHNCSHPSTIVPTCMQLFPPQHTIVPTSMQLFPPQQPIVPTPAHNCSHPSIIVHTPAQLFPPQHNCSHPSTIVHTPAQLFTPQHNCSHISTQLSRTYFFPPQHIIVPTQNTIASLDTKGLFCIKISSENLIPFPSLTHIGKLPCNKPCSL